MKPLLRFPIVVALVLTSAGLSQPTNAQTKPAARKALATINGKVTLQGKPASGVKVLMRPSMPADPGSVFKGITDQEGYYHIDDVPVGNYLVAPIVPAFVISDLEDPDGHTLVITEGGTVEGINFDLVRGGVIAGKVVDADGHPIIEERVGLAPVMEQRQVRPDYSQSSSTMTDDQGVYRIFGIHPGQYKVLVSQQNGIVAGGVARGHAPFESTFYPNTTDASKATVVEVGEGTETTNIDIALGPAVSGFTVTGRIVNEGGKPVPDMAIGLSRTVKLGSNSSSSSGATGVRSDNQGTFQLLNLPPGKYSLMIFPSVESNQSAPQVPFEVIDQDVTGLLVKCSSGASVSGIVVLEGNGDNSFASKISRHYIQAAVIGNGPNSGFGRGAFIKPDGSFQIGGFPPGTLKFFLGGNVLEGIAISRIERDGVAQPNGIQIQNAEQVTGIRVVVVQATGAVHGLIKLINGPWPPSGRMSVQLTKSGDPSGNLRNTMPDSRGYFLIGGLTTGTYEIRATAFVPGTNRVPGSISQIVTVTDGAPTDLILTIDLAQSSNP